MWLIGGMGVSGLATARYLRAHGRDFAVYEERKSQKDLVEALGFDGFDVYAQPPAMSGFSQVVVSPGFAADHMLIRAAGEASVEVVSEIEFAFRNMGDGRLVAVTGSNGKSTTVSLIHHVLVKAGLDARLCGNIGTPFVETLDDDAAPIYVVEVSSFQLEHVAQFHPEVAVLLNIAPDHLDRHGGFAGYEAAKLRLFERQMAEDLAVVHPDYADRAGLAAKCVVPSDAARVGETHLALDDFRVRLDAMPLLGAHNQINALFVCAVVRRFGVTPEQVEAALPSFVGLVHRMAPVGEKNGRLWVDDSKATNVHAAQTAADSIDRPYVLILGGSDKGETFDFRFQRPPQAIVAYGETAPQIAKDLASFSPHVVTPFEQACLTAHKLARPGDAVLLSPACASFDQFKSFKARGEAFVQIFQAIEES